MVISDPRQTGCSNLAEARWAQYKQDEHNIYVINTLLVPMNQRECSTSYARSIIYIYHHHHHHHHHCINCIKGKILWLKWQIVILDCADMVTSFLIKHVWRYFLRLCFLNKDPKSLLKDISQVAWQLHDFSTSLKILYLYLTFWTLLQKKIGRNI